jgi:hypothetical protein
VDENLLTPSDSFFFCCVDICAICSSPGGTEQLLFCVDCGEAFHTYCLQVPSQTGAPKHKSFNLACLQQHDLIGAQHTLLSSSSDASSSSTPTVTTTWKCLNCNKFCQQCHQSGTEVSCKLCNASFHLKCLNPKPKSTSHLLPPNEFTCSHCMPTSCVSCHTKIKKYHQLTQGTPTSSPLPPLPLELYIGKGFFSHVPKWGVNRRCLECLCADSFRHLSDLIHLSRTCPLCQQLCHLPTPASLSPPHWNSLKLEQDVDSTSGEDPSLTIQQCFGCFQFFHLSCLTSSSSSCNELYDLQTVAGEYLCVGCSVNFFSNSNRVHQKKNIDLPVYELMNQIQLQRLLCSSDTSLLPSPSPNTGEWHRSFTATLHSALIIWATKRYQALRLYGGEEPIIVTDNSKFRTRDCHVIGTARTVSKARKYLLLCEARFKTETEKQLKLSQLLTGLPPSL